MAVLTIEELNEILPKLPKGAARRILALCNESPAWTGELSSGACTVHPAAYKRAINSVLFSYGVSLVCRLPKNLKVNQWGEVSRAHIWSLVRFDRPAVNDPSPGREASFT